MKEKMIFFIFGILSFLHFVAACACIILSIKLIFIIGLLFEIAIPDNLDVNLSLLFHASIFSGISFAFDEIEERDFN